MSAKQTAVLVVEDDPVDQELLNRDVFNKRTDCDAWFVFTADEAIRRLKYGTNDRTPFHLVILDLKLTGMQNDGMWVLQEIERRNLKVPVAVLSAAEPEILAEAMRHKPVIAGIQKPLTIERLDKLLEMVWP